MLNPNVHIHHSVPRIPLLRREGRNRRIAPRRRKSGGEEERKKKLDGAVFHGKRWRYGVLHLFYTVIGNAFHYAAVCNVCGTPLY